MVSRVNTVSFQGIDVLSIDVQVQMASGLPAFSVVGLPDKAVAESRERVRSALTALGLALPPKRITVNLSPADLAKEGSHFDLPIALGLLATMDVISKEDVEGFVALGELALDGAISQVAGVLPAAIHANSLGLGLICPESQGGEAAWAGELQVLAPETLLGLINHFKGTTVLPAPEPKLTDDDVIYPDMADIKGQETARRALEVAAAGGHNMLMMGPPGSGKSMLASRLPGILPPLDPAEALSVSMIHSIAGELKSGGLLKTRPYRDPHHSASMPSLVGGGFKVKPGEISLAHHGVLFLDELPEFQRTALEALRQPLETGQTSIARANAHVTYPARFQLIAAMNPCRCGYLGDPYNTCNRAPKCGVDYQNKISGPMFDRIDLHVDVPAVRPADLSRPASSEKSATVAKRVLNARNTQRQRFHNLGKSDLRTNSEADGKLLEEIATPNPEGLALLNEAAEKMRLTARGYHRILRVARTLADLEAKEGISRVHIAEALAYRRIIPGKQLSGVS
jgi:magnesium chelatase family protein